MTDDEARPGVLLLADDLGSIRRARDHVRSRCRGAGVPARTCETAVLLTSEIVTNALVHARSAPRLGLSLAHDRLRVEVGDDDPTRPGPVTDVHPAAHSGRGLRLVEQLSDGWGIDAAEPGKVVWFVLDR